jgi:response regulator NasT
MNLETNRRRPKCMTYHGQPHELPQVLADLPQVYLLRGAGAGKAEILLRELAARADAPFLFLADLLVDAARVAALVEQGSDVLIVADGVAPGEPLLAGLLAAGAGLVVVTAATALADWTALAERHVVVFLPPHADSDGLWAAVVGAVAGLRRQAETQLQVRLIQQRLDDRILIERAKGILSRRLQIGEEQAYKRLRTTARRQRRSMRDVARGLLDADSLLEPFGSVPPAEEA